MSFNCLFFFIYINHSIYYHWLMTLDRSVTSRHAPFWGQVPFRCFDWLVWLETHFSVILFADFCHFDYRLFWPETEVVRYFPLWTGFQSKSWCNIIFLKLFLADFVFTELLDLLFPRSKTWLRLVFAHLIELGPIKCDKRSTFCWIF